MNTRVRPALESVELNSGCPVSAGGALTAAGNTTDPSGANQQASAAAAAMENSPTENQTKNKHGICAFFKRTWQALKYADRCRRRGNKVVPFQPQPDPADPLSPLESTALQHPADPQPGPSGLEPPAHHDSYLTGQNPIPGDAQVMLKSPFDTDPADPEPAEENQTRKNKKSGICAFFRRAWQAVKCVDRSCCRGNKVAPQPGPSGTEPSAHRDSDLTSPNPVPGESGLKPTTSDTDPADPEPAESPFLSLYEVGNKISAGMFGSVFQGTRKSDNQQVAIKFILKRKIDKYINFPGYSKLLLMEVALNLLLKKAPSSPNIVYMLEWFEEEDQHILILEYPRPCLTLLGMRLDCKYRTLNETQARGLMFQVVLAAKHCIDQGVFHRDIKPSNILVNTETMEVKLIDFGSGDLVKKSGYQYEFRGRYRPPEFYMKRKYHAGPTTVWSLGLMLFQMVTGRHAFPTEEEITAGNLTFDSSLSRECQDVISQCLIRDPDNRATLEQLLDHKWFQQEDDPAVAQESDESNELQ